MSQDCIAPLETGLRAYLAWVEGTDHVYLGNVAVNSLLSIVTADAFGGARQCAAALALSLSRAR